jgi:hypothetical protein
MLWEALSMRSGFVLLVAAATVALDGAPARACDRCAAAGHNLHGLPVPLPISQDGLGNGGGGFAATSSGLPLIVPELSSRPQAPAKLYLDFDGDFAPGWGPFVPGTTPAYSVDADASTFSSQDLNYINEIWSRVAEHYSPFEVDVTTVPPGPFDQRFFRIVIGGPGQWYANGTAGGVAYIGGFAAGFLPRTGFVFSSNLLPTDPGHASFVAAATSHEAGHGFNLEHQSSWSPNGELLDRYNRGDSVKAPIMGSSYRKQGKWWLGPSELGPSQIQDDLSVISGAFNAFGYRADDHGNTPAAATPLTISGIEASGAGVIERMNDVDYFSFQTLSQGPVSFELFPFQFGGMLDGSLALFEADGTLIQLVDTTSLGEILTTTLDAGSYRIAVLSHGAYGDIGQYTLTGQLGVPIPESSTLTIACAFAFSLVRRRPQR